MAHIPYGYVIERGRASPQPDKVEKLNRFIDAYLGGLSVKEARKCSGLELSVRPILNYLRSGIYAGTDYYPPIVPPGTKERILEELEKRTHPGFTKLPDDLPVHERFRIKKPAGERRKKASEIAEDIYKLIIPAEDGRAFMNAAEQAMVKDWVYRTGCPGRE